MKPFKSLLPLITLLLLVGPLAQAQVPNGYYDAANGKTGNELKTVLHDIIKGHTTVSYSNLWNAFWSTDNKGNGVVWDMYSDVPGGTPPYTYYLGEGQCGSYDDEGDCYNREHSWPESWFNGDGTARTDLHHIFPTDGWVNMKRGNNPFGEVQSVSWTSQNGSKLGDCKASLGYSGTVFEPIDAYKGDFARALMYMSVRYYSEDSNWGSSDMTNKSEILPWAIAMLMDWNEQDPVSQKELDRNNAVYSQYQHNRNPFVDHPEYARMIWDPNWQGGTYYAITCATGLQHGSVSAPESAMEGSTVAISATPELGYMVDTYSVYKTGSPNTTVTVSSNGTFTMPDYDVTVSATFVENNTYYDIALGVVSHGNISASPTSAKSGTNITLTANPENGYSLYAWYVFKTGDMGTTVSVSGNSFVMPAYDVTVMASFVQGSTDYHYVKVTTAPTDWSGEYLIVYENGSKAFNGGLTALDANDNTISVTINESGIASNTTTDAARFTIAPMSGGYSIQSASGKYIGYSGNSNGLTASATALQNTISLNNGNIIVRGTGASTLQYNNSANRFRYYGSTQQPIQFYKKTSNISTPIYTIYFEKNGGTGSMNDQTVNEFEPTALNANAFSREGYVFEGWSTTPDGSGDFYADGATVTLLSDLTLYAQWYYVQRYQLVTSADQLVAGRTYLIVNVANGKALGTTQNDNNRSAADVTIADGVIPSIDNTVCELTLGASGNNWTFFDAGWGSNGGYLYAASNSANQLKTQATNSANGQWSITFGTNGVATIQAQGNNTRNLLRYNNSSNIFSCYAAGNTQQDVCLFRRTEYEDYPADQHVTLASGWNWWAPTVATSVEALQAEMGANLLDLQAHDSTILGGLDVGQMYKIQTGVASEFLLSGMPATGVEVAIAPGCNWFGYPGPESLSLSALGISPTAGDKVVSQDGGFAIYNGDAWVGTLTSLQPGRGYVYYSTASQQKTMTF